MRILTSRQKDALRSGLAYYSFCEVQHPDGDIRVWSGKQDIVLYPGEMAQSIFEEEGAQLFLGRGDFIGVEGLEQETDFSIPEVKLVLSGVPPQVVADVTRDVTGRRAALHIGFVGPDMRIIDGLVNITIVTLDRTEFEPTTGTVIKLVGTVGLTSLNQGIRDTVSTAYQDAEFGAGVDTGFNRMPELQNLETERAWAPGSYRGVQ